MLKRMMLFLRSKLYFIPGIYTVVFVFAAFFVKWIDQTQSAFLNQYLPDILLVEASHGSDIFSMASGSLLSMLTITFSTMMVVLTIYGGQLSPRTLQDFLENRQTQRILGYFMGTFSFSVVSFFLIRDRQDNGQLIAPFIGIILIIIAVGVFARLIHFVAKSVQVSQYVQNLVKEVSDLIDKKQQQVQDNPQISNEPLDSFEKILDQEAYEIHSQYSGFIQLYEEEKLYALAKKYGVTIHCERRIGEHILEDDILVKVYKYDVSMDKEDKEEDTLTAKILKNIVVGDEINLYDDIGNRSRKLVEIAVRALSPGINDPGTAVFCIEKMGFLLHKIALAFDAKVYIDDEREVRLIVQKVVFRRLLYDHFYQIKLYGSKDFFVFDAMVRALTTIAKDSTDQIRSEVAEFSNYLMYDLDLDQIAPIEKEIVQERLYQLAIATGDSSLKIE
jgi:uncharacterized membrane protein